jgi:hypothetical protein
MKFLFSSRVEREVFHFRYSLWFLVPLYNSIDTLNVVTNEMDIWY